MELKQFGPDEGPSSLTKMSIKVSSVSGLLSKGAQRQLRGSGLPLFWSVPCGIPTDFPGKYFHSCVLLTVVTGFPGPCEDNRPPMLWEREPVRDETGGLHIPSDRGLGPEANSGSHGA